MLAIDLLAEILAYAKSGARLAGYKNVDTQVIDGEQLADLQEEPFDADVVAAAKSNGESLNHFVAETLEQAVHT